MLAPVIRAVSRVQGEGKVRKAVFRKPLLCAITLPAAAGFLVIFIIEVCSHPNGSDFLGGAIFSIFIYALWLLGWQSSVRICPRGIVVDNFLVRHSIPWGDLSGFEVEGGLQICLADGRKVGSLMYGGSLIGVIFNDGYTRKVAQRMRSASEKFSSSIQSEEKVITVYSSKFHIDWRAPLAIVGTLEAVSVVFLYLRLFEGRQQVNAGAAGPDSATGGLAVVGGLRHQAGDARLRRRRGGAALFPLEPGRLRWVLRCRGGNGGQESVARARPGPRPAGNSSSSRPSATCAPPGPACST